MGGCTNTYAPYSALGWVWWQGCGLLGSGAMQASPPTAGVQQPLVFWSCLPCQPQCPVDCQPTVVDGQAKADWVQIPSGGRCSACLRLQSPLLPAAAAHLWLGIPGQARLLGSLPTLPTPSVVGQFGGFSAGFAFTCQASWEAV